MKRISMVILMLVALTGCQTWSGGTSHPAPITTAGVQVQRGRPNQVIDGAGWVLGIPNKLALWDRRADNHEISPQTEADLVEYLHSNNLNNVLVRVNQYDPGGEWKRLTQNKNVSPGWRYTVGTYNTLKYTLIPGRLFGGDWYNPYTNTINLSSDIPTLALSEGAYAKHVHHNTKPGTYAAVREIPFVRLWHEKQANNEVLSYVKSTGTAQDHEEAFRIIYPNYGASWGEQIIGVLPYGKVAGRLVGASVGHAVNGVRKITSSDDETAQPAEHFMSEPAVTEPLAIATTPDIPNTAGPAVIAPPAAPIYNAIQPTSTNYQ